MRHHPRLELISFKLCPFVQRAAIALQEKGVDFQTTYIELKKKPDWFMAISPLGKVPILKVDDEVLFESAAIVEFLDETIPPRLHPEDPLQRARHRGWIEFSSELLMSQYHMFHAQEEESYLKNKEAVADKLAMIEKNMKGGAYFGENFSLVDVAFAPAFMRLAQAEEIRPLQLLESQPKVRRWSEALLTRPSVSDSVVPEFARLFIDALREGDSYLARTA